MTVENALAAAGRELESLFSHKTPGQDLSQRANEYTEADDSRQALSGEHNKGIELAFYGGTFTALDRLDFLACLQFGEQWRSRGLVEDMRCSTRPDALSKDLLKELAEAGFSTVELGVQSFSDRALSESRRGYSGKQAVRACEMVKEAGLRLGIQLLPGMPGHSLAQARDDLDQSLALCPSFVRLYPCLVLEGTALAAMWRRGQYRPWELEQAVTFLAEACHAFRKSGIPVIRMGLAEEPGLARSVLAGPRHPSIGSMARSRALLLYVREQLDAFAETSADTGALPAGTYGLSVPRRFQGEFWGQGCELEAEYAALGIHRANVSWWDEDRFLVEAETVEEPDDKSRKAR